MGLSPVAWASRPCVSTKQKCASDGRDARATSEIGSVKQSLVTFQALATVPPRERAATMTR